MTLSSVRLRCIALHYTHTDIYIYMQHIRIYVQNNNALTFWAAQNPQETSCCDESLRVPHIRVTMRLIG